MLKQLLVSNYAIFDKLELQFSNGMTVFTGETGAGKSILVDALGLVLGDRAEVSAIRPGSSKSEICGIFDIGENPQAKLLLEEQAIETEQDEIIIRRVIGIDGRSRAFINDSPVAVQLIKAIGDCLVDIHSQHDHQSLTRLNIQRELLDEYGAYKSELDAVHESFSKWQEISSRLSGLINSGSGNDAVSLLRYQVEELESVNPIPGEYDNLDDEHRRMANVSRLMETAQKAYGLLRDNEQSLHDQLNTLLSELRELEHIDVRIGNINQIIDDAGILINEAGKELRSYIENLEISPERLQDLETRLSILHDTARKHHIHPGQLTDHLEALRNQLSEYETNQQLLDDLTRKQSETMKQYRDCAIALHRCRVKSAKKMEKEITRQIQSLGMPEGSFSIRIESTPDDVPRPGGNDQVEFMVNINPGQTTQPLRKIASGGELSRIGLAIKVIARSEKSVPCLVFDEVDAGIGGGIAEIVGKLLQGLAGHYQVLCVTHLPQVASQGDNHLLVNKTTNGSVTSTEIRELDRGERIEEIARMMGGIKITEQTRRHAREMLEISGKK